MDILVLSYQVRLHMDVLPVAVYSGLDKYPCNWNSWNRTSYFAFPIWTFGTAVNVNIKMIMINSFICTLSLRLCLAPHGSKIAAWNIAMEQSCPSVHT